MKKLLNSINKVNAMMDRKQALLTNAETNLKAAQADLAAASERKQQAVHDGDEAAYNQADADFTKANFKIGMWQAQIKHFSEEPYITAEEYNELKNEILTNYQDMVNKDKETLLATFEETGLLNEMYEKEQQAASKTHEALMKLRGDIYCDPELNKFGSSKGYVLNTDIRNMIDYKITFVIDGIRSALANLDK